MVDFTDLGFNPAPMHFASGQPIYFQGSVNHSVYNVTYGTVRLDRGLPDGRRQVIGFALPGDFLGLSQNKTNAFSATAIGDVTVHRFNRDAFSSFLDLRPSLLRRLYDLAGHELNIAQEHLTVMGSMSSIERVASFLVSFRKRWERIEGHSATIPLPMTRQDIGDHLGLTIETVSRAITKLAQDKIILVVPGGVRVINEKRLTSLTQQ